MRAPNRRPRSSTMKPLEWRGHALRASCLSRNVPRTCFRDTCPTYPASSQLPVRHQYAADAACSSCTLQRERPARSCGQKDPSLR
jgi:hypothetical protein